MVHFQSLAFIGERKRQVYVNLENPTESKENFIAVVDLVDVKDSDKSIKVKFQKDQPEAVKEPLSKKPPVKKQKSAATTAKTKSPQETSKTEKPATRLQRKASTSSKKDESPAIPENQIPAVIAKEKPSGTTENPTKQLLILSSYSLSAAQL